jgi:hypothetical protein
VSIDLLDAANTVAPSSSPTVPGDGQQIDLNIAIIGGAAGGAAGLGALVGILGYRHLKRRASRTADWTEVDIARFRVAYHKNHDFEALCEAFPQYSRESVAMRAKSLMDKKPVFLGKDSFRFVRDRLANAWSRYYPGHNHQVHQYIDKDGSLIRVGLITQSLTPYASTITDYQKTAGAYPPLHVVDHDQLNYDSSSNPQYGLSTNRTTVSTVSY